MTLQKHPQDIESGSQLYNHSTVTREVNDIGDIGGSMHGKAADESPQFPAFDTDGFFMFFLLSIIEQFRYLAAVSGGGYLLSP